MTNTHDGGCLCGAVRFRTIGAPERLVMCHCKFCQKSTGGPYAIEVFFTTAAFAVIAGKPAIYEHRSAGSGKLLYLHFCPSCSTKLFTVFERYAGVLSVFGGCYDEPDWFEPAPVSRHVFLESARVGTVIQPGIDAYGAGSFAADGRPNSPEVFADFHVVRRIP